ncbi:MAG TPA: flagellar motor protein MotA, partial [Leeuwenhoekiella sp.]|nr:flagellar motor protein MotA [Leeuwenhoekiella sp.]
MKRVFSILVITAVIALGNLTAQANTAPLMTVNTTAIAAAVQEEAEEAVADETESLSFTQELKKRFIEGGPGFMGIVLLCLILGLAIAIERIIYLNLAT